MIPEEEACERLRGCAWLVSHGGVASEELCRLLDIRYPEGRASSSDRPIRGAVCHFPYPLPTGPDRAVYVYGSIFEAILSQHPRHPDNAAKLHNDEHYPRFYRVEDLLRFAVPDPFGAAAQFERFCDARVDYPILLVRYGDLERSIGRVCDFLGVPRRPFERRPRRSRLESLAPDVRGRLVELYGATHERMEAMPPVVLVPPKAHGRPIPRPEPSHVVAAVAGAASPPAGVAATPASATPVEGGALVRPVEAPVPAALVTCWTDLVHPARRLADRRLSRFRADVASVPARVKQPSIVLGRDRESWLFLNLRYDYAAASGQAYVLGFRIAPETYRPLDQGILLDIPNPCEHLACGRQGPEDQRAIRFGDETIVVFNVAMPDARRRIGLHRLERGRTVLLSIAGRELLEAEKNWMPFVAGGELRFVYRVDPLVVLRCVDLDTGRCEVIRDEAPEVASVHGSGPLEVHGGTELRPWRWPYYVGFVHSCAPWRPMFVVLDARESRWVHVGGMFDVPKPSLPEADEWRGKSVQFPASLEIETDRMLVGMEYEDRCPALLAMGLEFVESAIP